MKIITQSTLVLLVLVVAGLWISAPLYGTSENSGDLVNINTADVSRLATLPGIGEKTAERIIQFRQKHGSFAYPEDLMKVKGIGEKTFENLKDRITV